MRLQSLLLAFVLEACGHRAATEIDSWARSSSGVDFTKAKLLDNSGVQLVPERMESEAETMLSDVGCVELSPEQVHHFLGRSLSPVPGNKPYLVRGVYLNPATGGFSVKVLDDKLRVHHSCLGSSAVPMKRQALIVQLERMPKEVYVGCSMAE